MSGHGPSNLDAIKRGPSPATPDDYHKWADDFARWLAMNINAGLRKANTGDEEANIRRGETQKEFINRRITAVFGKVVHDQEHAKTHLEDELKKKKVELAALGAKGDPTKIAKIKTEITALDLKIKNFPMLIGKIREAGRMTDAVKHYMFEPTPFVWGSRP